LFWLLRPYVLAKHIVNKYMQIVPVVRMILITVGVLQQELASMEP